MAISKPKPVLPKAKPTISANVAAGRKPKAAPKSTYVSPNKMAGRKPKNRM
jgi:hypothetical protein